MSNRLRYGLFRTGRLGLFAASVATLGSCDGRLTATLPEQRPATAPEQPPGPPVGISIRSADLLPSLTLIVGGVRSLSAYAYDARGRITPASFAWSSADPTIATIGKSDGVVTAISIGTATVTATAGAFSASAVVSVVDISGTLAFTRITDAGAGWTADVLSYSASDHTIRTLPRGAQFASLAAAAWSPDGTLLAVDAIQGLIGWDDERLDYSGDVFILDAAAPASSPWRALTPNRRSRSPSWSPDGRRIAYVDGLMGSNNIYLIDAGGGQPTRLTSTEGAYETPRWSPDGTRLAFVNRSDVFIVNADGSGLINVTRSSAFDADPSWSPDGTRLAFVSNSQSQSPAVFVVVLTDLDHPIRLTWEGWAYGPVWSPDGRQIAFTLFSSRSGRSVYGLCVMNADGSLPVQLTNPPGDSWDRASAWKR